MIGHAWLFRTGAAVHQGVVQEIHSAIRKGDVISVRSMLQAGWRLEAAQALYMFLGKLPQPLIPQSIQNLVLDDNANVPVQTIAMDVLGLMKQELSARHLELASILLHLLDTIIKYSPADELRGNTLPISMLPIFFNIQSQHMQEWRRIATIFLELIRQASQHLDNHVRALLIDNVHVTEEENHYESVDQLPLDLQELLSADNLVTRTFLFPVGFRGDCNNLEVYRCRNNITKM